MPHGWNTFSYAWREHISEENLDTTVQCIKDGTEVIEAAEDDLATPSRMVYRMVFSLADDLNMEVKRMFVGFRNNLMKDNP